MGTKHCWEPLFTGEAWDRVSQIPKGANLGGALTLDFWPPNWEYKAVLF